MELAKEEEKICSDQKSDFGKMNAELEIAMMSAVERMQKEVRDSNLEAKEPS